jgi:predicted  nucleic acid-binding Zn-ribbon protein
VTKKILPARPASGRSQRDVLDEVEKLREENFTLKITVDDLEQQLADCESEVRKEVVEIMTEQLEVSGHIFPCLDNSLYKISS